MFFKLNFVDLRFIRKFILLFLFSVSLKSLNAQNTSKLISLNLKNVSFKEFVQQVENLTDYTFVYRDALIDEKSDISIQTVNSPSVEIINEVLAAKNLEGVFTGNTITVKKKSDFNVANVKKVQGIITDASHEPIIGASVIDIATKQGTITDFNGAYTLEVPVDAILRVSYVGFNSVDIKVGGSNQYNITLSEDVKALDEVVVIGYGTITKREMTSAIAHISSKDFLKSSSLDAAMLIQGKAAGVTVSNIGLADPNRQASIQIRGVSSRNAGLEPLVVIDGIPGGNLTNINPEDIESMDILKDGAASAIYGTRASNGVIMVTTKKGSKDGNLHVTYNTTLTYNKLKKELDLLDADEFRAYRTINNSILDKGGNTVWLDEITRLGYSNKHALSFSGGKAGSSYRATVDWRTSDGIDLRSHREEYGARLNIDHSNRTKLFNFTLNAIPRVINREKSDWSVFSTALWANPTKPVRNDDGTYADFIGETASYNPVERLDLEQSGTEIKLFEWDATAKLNLLPLDKINLPYDMALSTQITFAQSLTDKFDYFFRPSISNIAIASGIRGEANRSYENYRQDKLEWVANYSAQIESHKIRFVGGYSYQYDVASSLSGSNKDFSSDLLSYNDLGSGEYLSAAAGRTGVSSNKYDSKLIGFFGRITYDWKERYLLTASYRHEGSSRFGLNHKWGGFPAVSGGWMISSEPFMKDLYFIKELKLRADFGITGNQDIGNYHSLSTYRAFGNYLYNGQYFKVWGPSSNTNTELRWEKGYNKNIGLDFGLFAWLDGSINYYHRKQVDLLGSYSVPVPPNLFNSIYANVGSMMNQGFEFDFSFDVINSKKFNYKLQILGAVNDNKFLSFSNDVYQGEDFYWTATMANPNNPGPIQQIKEGERVGNFVTYRYAGVSEYGNWLIYNTDGDVIPIGEGTNADKVITGNGLPWFTGSMTHNLSYKNWDMSVFFRTALGFDIFNVHDFYWGLQSMEGNVLRYAYSKNAKITTGKNVVTDYFIEKGDYLKLDMISLGYSFDINNKHLDRIRLSATANNIYTLTRFLGVDPATYEINGLTPGTWGGSLSYYPSAFQFIFGLSVDF